MPKLHPLLCSIFFAAALTFSACSEPPDETPLGRETAAILARPEAKVDHVTISHVLVAFVGATRGSESGRNMTEARTLAEELLQRARGGENFEALMSQYSNDDGGGTYKLTEDDRHDFAKDFQAVAYRLAVGEIGVAAYHPSRCPFGWHVIKRIE